jgi:hypothetical protein
VQQFQPLRRYRYRQYCHARSIAAWPVKAGDKTEPNDGHLTLHQIGCQCRQSIVLIFGEAKFDRDVCCFGIGMAARVTRAAGGDARNRTAGLPGARRLLCPLWVKSGHFAQSGRCPLYLQKQTSLAARVLFANRQTSDVVLKSVR